LQHIRFNGKTALAYNDIAAIEVKCDADVEACLPGDSLIKILNSFSADTIAFQMGKENEVLLSSGRSKMKIPMLELKEHPYETPELEDRDAVDLDASILRGIELCLLAVGNDPTHPAQMGVTLDVDEDGKAVLWATDNFTISRYQTKSDMALPNAEPIILPIFFCQQLLSLAKAFPDDEITLYPMVEGGAVYATFGKSANVLTKTLIDLEPLDFHRIFSKHCGKLATLLKDMEEIPAAWDAAFQRALLVLNDLDKVTRVRLDDKEIQLYTTGDRGDSDDAMPFEGTARNAPDGDFFLDPSLVKRVSDKATQLTFTERALVLSTDDGSYIHLIAYSSK